MEIPVPIRGFVEGMSGVGQPPATYAAGFNMRCCDPGSEQVGLTPRAGLLEMASALGGSPREIFLAGRETPPHTWHELTTTAQAGVTPTQVAALGSSDARGLPLAFTQGSDGTIYVLREDGAVDIFNAERKYIETAETPVPRGFTLLPRIQVDEDRAIYMVGVRDDPLDGGTSRVIRLRRRNEVYALHWSQIVVEPIADFAYTRNSLYLYANPLPTEGASEQLPRQRATLTRLTQVFASLPVQSWVRTAPRPAFRVIGMTDGSAVLMSPSNALRNNAAVTSFTDRNIGWSPRELATWEERVHAWVDGVRPNDGFFAEAATPVDRLADARRFESAFPPTTDATLRELVVDPDRDFEGPEWAPDAFGGLGGTRFASDATAISGPNRDQTDIALQEAMVPGIAATTWAMFVVIQVDRSAMEASTSYRVMTHAGDAAEFALFLTVDLSGGNVRVTVSDLSGPRGTATSTASSETLLLTIVHLGVSPTNCRLRLDGTHVANISFGQVLSGGGWPLAGTVEGPGPRTLWGRARGALDHNIARAATTFELYTVGSPSGSHAGRLRDGKKVAGGGNRLKLRASGGFPTERLRARFNADPVTLDGMAVWTSNIGSQAKTVRVRALSGGFSGTGTDVFVQEFTLEQRTSESQFPARDWLDFETQVTAEYWELDLLEAHGSGGDWGLTEVEFARRSEPQVLTLAEPAGLDDILLGAPFALGEAIVLLTPTEPGAVNGSAPVGSAVNLVTEVEAVEGYLAHRFGIAHQLPVDHPYTGAGNFPQGAGDDRRDQIAEIALNSQLPVVARVATSGELLWAEAGAGVGLGAAEVGGGLFTIGEAFPPTGDALTTPGWGNWLRRWRDTGRELDDAHASAWEVAAATAAEDAQVRAYDLAVDGAGDLYLVRQRADQTVTLERRRGENGTAVFALAAPVDARPVAFIPAQGRILRNPGDTATAGPARAFGLFRAVSGALRTYPIMGQSASGTVRPRELEVLTAVGSALFSTNEDGATAPVVGATVLQGDELWSATLFGKTFLGSGRGYQVYDHEFRTLRSFEGSTRGEFPERCRLGVPWNGRLWLAAGDNPFDWWMSRWGDPFDMDFYPEVPDEAQPVSAQSSPIGPIPDPVRCLMPWTSDVAYVGCEGSLWRIEGDPASDGRLVAVAQLGVAFGQGSYTRDDRGNLYFYAAHGEVFTVRFGSGQPVSLTDKRIGARLRDIDLSVWRPKLVWNTAERTLHVFFLPRDGAPVANSGHFAWQADFDAWHPDVFTGGAERCVMAAAAFDGSEPGDRTIILGNADGSLRRWDRYAHDDAGMTRPWSFVAGPLADRSLVSSLRLSSLHVTSLGTGVYNLRAWGTHEAYRAGAQIQPTAVWRLQAGQTGGASARAAGPMIYVALNGTDTVTVQGIHASAVSAGRTGR